MCTNKFIGRSCVYFIKLLSSGLYKFGSTSNVSHRLRAHSYNKLYKPYELIDIIDCDVFHIQVENHIKKVAADYGELTHIGPHKEIIKTRNISKYISSAKLKAMSYHGYIVDTKKLNGL